MKFIAEPSCEKDKISCYLTSFHSTLQLLEDAGATMCLQFYDTQKSSSRQLGAQCLYVCYMLIHAACATHEVAGAGAIVLCLHGHDHLWD